ncbi:MAG: hypothetical protein ANABAC_0663 [Anaerolineae bacterium]|nr:MAG: hypothetical protein ANABAC_0663 [Anaerolineae bacterium]
MLSVSSCGSWGVKLRLNRHGADEWQLSFSILLRIVGGETTPGAAVKTYQINFQYPLADRGG